MSGRYAVYRPKTSVRAWLLCLILIGAAPGAAQTYVAFDPPNNSAVIEAASQLSIRKTNGKNLIAPTLPGQIGFADVQISADGRRVGWLALMRNCCTSYPAPLKLVVVRGDKIERVIDDGIGIFGWDFENDASVAYWEDTLHFSSGKRATLRDIITGKEVASVDLERVDGDIRADVLERAPNWVREIPGIER